MKYICKSIVEAESGEQIVCNVNPADVLQFNKVGKRAAEFGRRFHAMQQTKYRLK